MTLLDTDVMIEIQKGTAFAVAWMQSAASIEVAVPAAVALELIVGSRDKSELKKADKFLSDFDVVKFSGADYDKAYELIVRHRLSTGLSLPDFLIAAQAINHNATLYTFNLKHFGAIPDLDAQAPYARAQR